MLQIVEVHKGEILSVLKTYKRFSAGIELKARNAIQKFRTKEKYRTSCLIYLPV